jgi:hypothetical protein
MKKKNQIQITNKNLKRGKPEYLISINIITAFRKNEQRI